MAEQIEELHQRVQTLLTQQQQATWSSEQQQHLQREKEGLQQRVAELETGEAQWLQENAQLKQHVNQVKCCRP